VGTLLPAVAMAQTPILNRAISETDVLAAQKGWCTALVNISEEGKKSQKAAKALAEKVIDGAYAYQLGPVLFKPTLTSGKDTFRLTKEGALSYFVGGDSRYPTDSGFDVHSSEEIEIGPFGRALVPTGVKFNLPENHEIQVRSKSGLALKQGLMVLNSPGTVDNGYTGEVQVIVFNTNNYAVSIPKGMKIAQAVLCPVVNGGWVSLEETKQTINKDRNENGFGSTGII
jgi:deoxyuridine 5'-triphosphate nucleotidohydrolase